MVSVVGDSGESLPAALVTHPRKEVGSGKMGAGASVPAAGESLSDQEKAALFTHLKVGRLQSAARRAGRLPCSCVGVVTIHSDGYLYL